MKKPILFHEHLKDFTMEITEDMPSHPWWFIFLIYLTDILLLIVIIFGIYANHLLDPIVSGTAGLLQRVLLMSPLLFGILIIAEIRYIGKTPYKALGFENKKLLPGIAFYVVFWILLNFLAMIGDSIFGYGGPFWFPYWLNSGMTITSSVGELIGQIFGNVPFEEVLFRGYFFAQLTKKFCEKYPNKPILAINLGTISANMIFATIHIPIRIAMGYSFGDILWNLFVLFGIGYLFTAVYVFSKNIYFAMAIHIMWNIPFLLVYNYIPANLMIIILLVFFMLGWFIKQHRQKNRNLPSEDLSNLERIDSK